MIYFISDLHFYHDKPFIWQERLFPNVKAMNEVLVRRWNKKVLPDDTVYVLGDFCFKKNKIKEMCGRLNGHKHLIYGNHDHPSSTDFIKAGFESAEYAKMLHVKGVGKFWLCHYPTILDDGFGRSNLDSVICVHGHTHSDSVISEYGYHVGVDATFGHPVPIDGIIDIMLLRTPEGRKKLAEKYKKQGYKMLIGEIGE